MISCKVNNFDDRVFDPIAHFTRLETLELKNVDIHYHVALWNFTKSSTRNMLEDWVKTEIMKWMENTEDRNGNLIKKKSVPEITVLNA